MSITRVPVRLPVCREFADPRRQALFEQLLLLLGLTERIEMQRITTTRKGEITKTSVWLKADRW